VTNCIYEGTDVHCFVEFSDDYFLVGGL